MKRLYFVFLIVVILFPLPAHAQSADDCDPFSLAAIAKSSIPGPEEPPPDGKPETLWAQLRTVANTILRADARCKGHFWTESGTKVIGPIDIPAGLYKATAEGAGYFILDLTVIDGECGHKSGSYVSTSLFAEYDAVAGIETLLTSTDCQVLLEIESNADWSLTFERVN